MNILSLLQTKFRQVFKQMELDPAPYLTMIRISQDRKFGDYQANFAMPLKAVLKENPREIAQKIIDLADLDDNFEPPEIAGPGFINLTLKDDVIINSIERMATSTNLDVDVSPKPGVIVVDFSSPNVAKPMHVGHLRSTVIGDAIVKICQFLGHTVISDNHIGDWGTQFGMIIYGYNHFLDKAHYEQAPVDELARLYRLVNQLCDLIEAKKALPTLTAKLEAHVETKSALLQQNFSKEKERKKALDRWEKEFKSLNEKIQSIEEKIENGNALNPVIEEHPEIIRDSRRETAKLHEGDARNLELWKKFLPHCLDSMNHVYDMLDIKFEHTLGESFYNDSLGAVVQELSAQNLAVKNEGAVCVFIEGKDAPLIIQKTDGAFTYGTTDLATIKYRVETWQATTLLYVVDSRQGEHFNAVFETARKWRYDSVDYRHLEFGMVTGSDGKPYKTRSGDTVGLISLLEESIVRARKIVDENDDNKRNGPELHDDERKQVAEYVGIGGVKYADLMHNRDSDYEFKWDVMLASKGNTSTYIQYAIARIHGIYRRMELNRGDVLESNNGIMISKPVERDLMMQMLRFEETLCEVTKEYRPHILCQYLFDTAEALARFYNECRIIDEQDESIKNSRLVIIGVASRVLEQGLALLGIKSCERM